jgi:hypothetical protein
LLTCRTADFAPCPSAAVRPHGHGHTRAHKDAAAERRAAPFSHTAYVRIHTPVLTHGGEAARTDPTCGCGADCSCLECVCDRMLSDDAPAWPKSAPAPAVPAAAAAAAAGACCSLHAATLPSEPPAVSPSAGVTMSLPVPVRSPAPAACCSTQAPASPTPTPPTTASIWSALSRLGHVPLPPQKLVQGQLRTPTKAQQAVAAAERAAEAARVAVAAAAEAAALAKAETDAEARARAWDTRPTETAGAQPPTDADAAAAWTLAQAQAQERTTAEVDAQVRATTQAAAWREAQAAAWQVTLAHARARVRANTDGDTWVKAAPIAPATATATATAAVPNAMAEEGARDTPVTRALAFPTPPQRAAVHAPAPMAAASGTHDAATMMNVEGTVYPTGLHALLAASLGVHTVKKRRYVRKIKPAADVPLPSEVPPSPPRRAKEAQSPPEDDAVAVRQATVAFKAAIASATAPDSPQPQDRTTEYARRQERAAARAALRAGLATEVVMLEAQVAALKHSIAELGDVQGVLDLLDARVTAMMADGTLPPPALPLPLPTGGMPEDAHV